MIHISGIFFLIFLYGSKLLNYTNFLVSVTTAAQYYASVNIIPVFPVPLPPGTKRNLLKFWTPEKNLIRSSILELKFKKKGRDGFLFSLIQAAFHQTDDEGMVRITSTENSFLDSVKTRPNF